MKLKTIGTRVILVEALSFGGLVALVWLNEILDLPCLILGAPATAQNLPEAGLESLVVLCVAALSINFSRRLIKRIRALEEIIPICSHCRRVRNTEGTWELLETHVAKSEETAFSHGICPDCLREYYPDIADNIIAEMERKDMAS